MGIDEKTQYAPDNWREERDRQALYCLANFLPGKAFERWWVYGLVSDIDSRSGLTMMVAFRYRAMEGFAAKEPCFSIYMRVVCI